jgi:hypothetical protein
MIVFNKKSPQLNYATIEGKMVEGILDLYLNAVNGW